MNSHDNGAAAAERTVPGPRPRRRVTEDGERHRGVIMSGKESLDGGDGPKAFYIHVEARPGREEQVEQTLRDILGCVEGEPATGPWYAVRYSQTTFGIFETFPDIAGRQAHVDGGGGDIFRDLERMNAILVEPAHVFRLDVLLSKRTFSW